MRKCPKCGSTDIQKETWNDAVLNAQLINKEGSYNYTGDLICCDCKYSNAPDCFEDKTS